MGWCVICRANRSIYHLHLLAFSRDYLYSSSSIRAQDDATATILSLSNLSICAQHELIPATVVAARAATQLFSSVEHATPKKKRPQGGSSSAQAGASSALAAEDEYVSALQLSICLSKCQIQVAAAGQAGDAPLAPTTAAALLSRRTGSTATPHGAPLVLGPGRFQTLAALGTLDIRVSFPTQYVDSRCSVFDSTRTSSNQSLVVPKHAAIPLSFVSNLDSGSVAAFADICAEKSRIALSLSSAHASVYPTQLRSLQALASSFSGAAGGSQQPSALPASTLSVDSLSPPSSVGSVSDTIWTLPEALMIECDSSQLDICGEPPPCVLTGSDNSALPFAYITPILTVACNGCELSAYRSFTTHTNEDHAHASSSSHASSSASALSKLTKIFSRKRTLAPSTAMRETSFTLCAGIELFSVLSSSTRSLLFDAALTSASDRLSLKLMEIASVSAGIQLPLVERRTENSIAPVPNQALAISELRVNVSSISLFAFPSMFFAATVLSQFSNPTPSNVERAATVTSPTYDAMQPTPLDTLQKFLSAPVNVHCVLHSAHARLFNEQLIAVLAVSTEELIFESPVVVTEGDDGASGLLERSFIASWSSLRVCALPALGHVVPLTPPSSGAYEEAFDPYAPLNFIPFFSGSAASSSASSTSSSSGSLTSSKLGGVVAARPGTGHWVSIERCSFLLQTVATGISNSRPSVELDVAIGLTRPCINVDVSQLDRALCILHRHMLPFLPSVLDHTVLPPSGLDKFHSKSIAAHDDVKSNTLLAPQERNESSASRQDQSLNPMSSTWTLNWRLEINRSLLFVSSPDSTSLPDEENSIATHKCPGTACQACLFPLPYCSQS